MDTEAELTNDQRQRATIDRFQSTYESWTKAAAEGLQAGYGGPGGGGEEILSIERAQVVDVVLELFGPTSYLRFIHEDDYVTECAYYTTAYSRTGSELPTFTRLDRERGQELYDLLGL